MYTGPSVDLRRRFDALVGFVGVRGNKHRHSRQHPHQRQVFNRLVASAVFAQRDAGVAEAEFNVEMRIANAVADLVVASSRKNRKRGAEGNQAHRAHAGRHVHHIGFGNAAVKEPFRIGLFKGVGHRGVGQVGVQHNHLVVGFAEFHKGLTIGNTCSFLFHLFSPPVLSVPAQPVPRSGLCRASQPGLP